MNLRISDKRTERRIAQLQKRTEAASADEVVRRALQAYDLLTSAASAGSAIVLCERNGIERELMIV